MSGETQLSFAVIIGTNNRYTIPPEVIKGLAAKTGDVLQLNATKLHKEPTQ